MEVRIFKLTFDSMDMARKDIPKIRGFISNKYPEYDELHNHNGDKFIYKYPIVQYKAVSGIPMILGINEGADVLSKLESSIDNLNISGENIEIYEKGISYVNDILGIADTLLKYKFISPWMALNENNYYKYYKASDEEKTEIIKKILIGNVLSLCKGLGYTVEEQLNVFVNLQTCKINFKNQEMLGFKGEFLINFHIPDFIGIGKSVSRGFGTVKLIKDDGFK